MAFAATEGADAAGFAEEMMDHLFIELVIGEVVFAGFEFEFIGGSKGQPVPGFGTDGAVTDDWVGWIDLGFEAYRAAMAASFMVVGHRMWK